MCQIKKGIKRVVDGLSGATGIPNFSFSQMDYDEYWQARSESAGVQPRFPIMADRIKEGSSVLDIGCGDGTFLSYLKSKKQVDEYGIDISQIAVERALIKGVEAQTQTLDEMLSETKEQKYDYVVASEVIEHIPDPEVFVEKAWSLTHKSLLITFPNIAYWPHRVRLLCGRFPVQWVHHPGEHLRFWSIHDFSDWLRELNLGDVYETSYFPSNGFTPLNLHKRYPNIFCNQLVVKIDKYDEKSE